MADYDISLGVTFESVDIQQKLNALAKNLSFRVAPTLDTTKLENQLKRLNFNITVDANGDYESLTKGYTKEFKWIRRQAKQLANELNKTMALNNNVNTPKSAQDKITSLQKYSNNLNSAVANLGKHFNEATGQWTTNNEFFNALEKIRLLSPSVTDGLNQIKDVQNQVLNVKNTDALKSSWIGLGNSLNELEQKYSKVLSKKSPQTFKELKQLQQAYKGINFDKVDKSTVADFSTKINKMTTKCADLDKQASTTGSKLKSLFNSRLGSMLTYSAIYKLVGALTQLKDNVIEIDSKMAQLQIVTGETGTALQNYFDRAVSSAKELGKSVTDVLSSMETYARLGYTADESLKLTTVTGQLANVGAMSMEDATTGTTSILKAYNINANDSERIGDILDIVGKNYAVSASELADALEHGGSALEAANNSLEESVALIAAGNAAVQNSSVVGNALKSSSMRIRSSNAELEEMGEDVNELVNTTPKLRQELLKLSGVDILKSDEQTFKSTYEIMLEIAQVWDSLSDVNQATILEDLAGKRNASVIKSIITNVKDLKGAYKDALNSEGTLANDNAIYMDTAQAKINQLTATFEDMSTKVLSSEVIGSGVDFLASVIDSIGKISDGFGALPTIISAITVVKLIKELNTARKTGELAGGVIGSLVSLVKNLGRASEIGATGMTKLSLAVGDLSKAEKTSIVLSILSLIAIIGTSIYSNIQESNQELEEQIQKVKDLKSAYEDTVETTTSNKTSLKGLIDNGTAKEFETLQKGVSKTGENLTLTNDQYQRYTELCEEIVGYSPDLKKGYDNATEALSAQNSVIEKGIDLLNKKQQAEAKKLFKEENLSAMVDTSIADYTDAKEKLNDYELKYQNSIAEEFRALKSNFIDDNASIVAEDDDILDILGIKDIFYSENFDNFDDRLFEVFTKNWGSIKGKINNLINNDTPIKYTTASGKELQFDYFAKSLNNVSKNIDTAIYNYSEKIDNAKKTVDTKNRSLNNSLTNALQQSESWYKLQQPTQQALTNWVKNNTDFNISNIVDENDPLKVAQGWVKDIDDFLNKISSNEKLQIKLTDLVSLDKNTLSAKDYAKQIDNLASEIAKSFNTDSTDIKKLFGFEDIDLNKTLRQIDKIKSRITDTNDKTLIDNYLNSLTSSELDKLLVLITNDTDKSINSFKELKKAVDDISTEELLDSLATPEDLLKDLDGLKSAYSIIESVSKNYADNGKLSIDDMQSLLSLNQEYLNALTNENGQIELNTEGYKELAKAQLNQYKAKLISATADSINSIKTEAQANEILKTSTDDLSKSLNTLAEQQLATAYTNAQLLDSKNNTDVFTKSATVKIKELYSQLAVVDLTIKGVSETTFNSTDVIKGNIDTLDNQIKTLEKQNKALDKEKQAYEDNIDVLQDKIDTIQDEIDALQREEEQLNRQKEAYDTAYDDIENLLDITQDYVKQGLQDEIDGIDKSIEALEDKQNKTKETIEAQKELLQAEKDEYDWRKTIREKNNAVSEAQAKVDAYKFDNSAEGKVNLQNAQSNLQSAIEDRNDEFYNHSIDTRTDNLDKLSDRIDKIYDKRKEKLEQEKQKLQDLVNNEVYIRKQASKLIDKNEKSLYKKLKKYANTYTTKTTAEVKDIWKNGRNALRTYNKTNETSLSLMNRLKSRSIKLGDSITANKNKQQTLNDKVDKINLKVKYWKNKVDKIDDAEESINRKIDDLKDKQDDLNDKLSSANNTTNEIADNMGRAAKNADEFIKNIAKQSKISGYQVKFGSKVYTTKETDINKAATKLQKAIRKSYGSLPTSGTAGISKIVDTDWVYDRMEAYAKGTKSAKGGIALTDEEGVELKFTKAFNNSGKYTILQDGDKVFSNGMTEILWGFAKDPNGFAKQFINDNVTSSMRNIVDSHDNNNNSTYNNTNNITIQGNADDNTIRKLKKAIGDDVIKRLISVNSNRYR